MPRIVPQIIAASALTLAAIIAFSTTARAGDIEVIGAFARASASPAARSGAAYVSFRNNGAAADRLVAVATTAARSTELHRSFMEGDVMRMEPVPGIDIAPGATLEMAPGGIHIMFMGLAAPLREGTTVDLVVTFSHAGTMAVTVPVAGKSAGGHDHDAGGSDATGG
jgi:hypothetical protein